MTTKELLQNAYEITSELLDVHRIYITNGHCLKGKWDKMEITVFYSKKGEKTKFSVDCYSVEEFYSVETLLTKLETEAKNIHRSLFPNAEEKTTDLEIEVS